MIIIIIMIRIIIIIVIIIIINNINIIIYYYYYYSYSSSSSSSSYYYKGPMAVATIIVADPRPPTATLKVYMINLLGWLRLGCLKIAKITLTYFRSR